MIKSDRTKTAEIKINKDVVKHLSIGLYRNFALAIKELISNSYDAGAKKVKIKLDLRKKRIIIRDDGWGMSEKEFTDEYLHIGFFKEPSKEVDELGRLRIGTFGIGFLAPLPYCKKMRLITKKRGEKEVLEGEINAENFFKKGTWEIKEEKVEYTISQSDLSLNEGETIIVLENIKDQIYDELKWEKSARRTIEGVGYEEFKWTLRQYCPIQFPPDRKDLIRFFTDSNREPMRLWLDGEELFRNIPEGAKVLEKDSKEFGDIYLKYVIMSPFEAIHPEESKGLQLRLRDVAIGYPRDFEVTKLGRVLGKLNMLCGEVHIFHGLDNALLVNRDSFNFTQDVADMYDFFRKKITQWDSKLYNWGYEDKEIYLALGKIDKDKRIINSLKKANLLHFSRKRFRLQESPLIQSKKSIIDKPIEKISKALTAKSEKSFKVILKKDNISSILPAIEVNEDKKSIIIHENHPVFIETINYFNKTFRINYDNWNPHDSPYSICRLDKVDDLVTFNKSHPLFNSKLNEEKVKRLSLGILIILNNTPNKDKLIRKLNNLLEDTFTE